MKPFDLDAARAGASVCTRAGAGARIICFDRAATYPVVALVLVNGVEDVKVYTITGRYFSDGDEHSDDLVMQDDDDSVDFIRCPAGSKGPEGFILSETEDRDLSSAFDMFPDLRKFIVEMASTGYVPHEWCKFISCLASALGSSKESASGAASPADGVPLSHAASTDSISIDRMYWRRVYAAQALQGYVQSGEVNNDPSATYTAARCVALADAMLERLEKF